MIPCKVSATAAARRRHPSRSTSVDVVVIGGGFAGVSTAAALAREGLTDGLILEREVICGSHASGRNAAIARQVELDPILSTLALRGVRALKEKVANGQPILRRTGALYLMQATSQFQTDTLRAQLEGKQTHAQWFSTVEARRLFTFLEAFTFDHAIWSPADGVVDIHALLSDLLMEARCHGLKSVTGRPVESLIIDKSVVRGVRTADGEIYCRIVVDATGAWAGRLGRQAYPLPLRSYRRHLFVSDRRGLIGGDDPVVWDLDIGYYVRPEGPGLLLCPCDETIYPPGVPAIDFEAEMLLADKLTNYVPKLADIALRRRWACLRTFTPDRRPLIGWDPDLKGLFHVSGLGGFGVTTSLAVGELASARICNRAVDWIDVEAFSASRHAIRTHGAEWSPNGAEGQIQA
ncbi:MAG: FAD-dependent oxidoreductase [Bryobacteraceae bacterium]